MKKTLLPYAFAALFALPLLPAQAEDAMFARGVISDDGAFGLTLSPDGDHALWVRSGGKRDVMRIMESHKVNGVWQPGTVVPWSAPTGSNDIDPAFSPDGKFVIFESNRPVADKPERKRFDIYSVAIEGGKWGEARNLGDGINSDASESSATIAANGNIYFMKEVDKQASSDLWVSRFVNGRYQAPENLGAPINTNERESNPFIAPDESYIIYFSTMKQGEGEIDLYISFREKNGWSAPRNLGAPINSKDAEFAPFVHGGRLYLARQSKGQDRFIENIYNYPFDPSTYRK